MSSGLSSEGTARRAEMLRELQGVMRRRRALKVGMRIGSAAVLVATASAVVVFSRSPGVSAPSPHVPEPAPRLMAVYVATDDGIMERLSASSDGSRVQLLADGDLWEWLDGAGRTEGWIRTGGRVILASDLTPRSDEQESDSAI